MNNLSLIYLIASTIFGVGGFLIRNWVTDMVNRINQLEDQMPLKLIESAVRQLINDKYDPIRDELKSINNKIDKILFEYRKQND